MKKYLLTLLAVFTLAGCAPDEEDVVRTHNKTFARECTNLSVTQVTKLNGFKDNNDSKVYTVEYEYAINVRDKAAFVLAIQEWKVERDIYQKAIKDATERDALELELTRAAKAFEKKYPYDFSINKEWTAEYNKVLGKEQARYNFLTEEHENNVNKLRQFKYYMREEKVANELYFKGCSSYGKLAYSRLLNAPREAVRESGDPSLWFAEYDTTFAATHVMRNTEQGWRFILPSLTSFF